MEPTSIVMIMAECSLALHASLRLAYILGLISRHGFVNGSVTGNGEFHEVHGTCEES